MSPWVSPRVSPPTIVMGESMGEFMRGCVHG